MGLDAELYCCHKDDLNIEKVFLYNGFAVTNGHIYEDSTDSLEVRESVVQQEIEKSLTKYGKDLLDDLELINENLSRSDFRQFVKAYTENIDGNAFINSCFTVVTFSEMKNVLEKHIKDSVTEGWMYDLQDTIYINDVNMRYIFRADW